MISQKNPHLFTLEHIFFAFFSLISLKVKIIEWSSSLKRLVRPQPQQYNLKYSIMYRMSPKYPGRRFFSLDWIRLWVWRRFACPLAAILILVFLFVLLTGQLGAKRLMWNDLNLYSHLIHYNVIVIIVFDRTRYFDKTSYGLRYLFLWRIQVNILISGVGFQLPLIDIRRS